MHNHKNFSGAEEFSLAAEGFYGVLKVFVVAKGFLESCKIFSGF